ncbi:MAG: class I SAM-dependent methyltransferase, partial [Bacteroidales bacterium]|nr:class I SAM-dependent methyltransferase [Candidatus Cryptobacteroides faecihippi]
MESAEELYLRSHSTAQTEALDWLEKQTHIHTNYPRMLSGAVQGRFLTMLTRIAGARRVLEIGTFTGYSATCFAYGLDEGGMVDTLEINDELEDLIREGWRRAGTEDRITLHIGDARKTLETLEGPYDIVYMDANKREY